MTDEAFWARVDTTGDCWTWQGYRNPDGYGRITRDGKGRAAHRYAYEQMVAVIPDGLHLDHLCRNRACVNPGHLDPVTPAENIRRGEVGIHNLSKTHCLRGHEFTSENTRINRDGWRTCITCKRARDAESARERRRRARV